MISPTADRPFTIAIVALGGQGGGVLTGWLVDTAERNGYLAQSTYVAGVAQRTGATVYCVELYSKEQADRQGRAPVFTPYPVPGDVDLVIAGEMAETGRAMQKGFVTPNCTTLIASSHRVYSITEKEVPDNGILDQAPIAELASKIARKFVCFDMEAAAQETDSIISAVMLGAVAASDVLPFSRGDYEQTIRATGRSVEQNLAGFDAGFTGASSSHGYAVNDEVSPAAPEGQNGRELAERIEKVFPDGVRKTALQGALRCLDYQDRHYAEDYLDLLGAVVQEEKGSCGDSHNFHLSAEVARQLALQMCYEDIVRVAELKTRAARTARVRRQLAASDNQPVNVVEYFHPRIEEFCDGLPARIGQWLLNSKGARWVLGPLFGKGRNIQTTSISGFLALRLLAKQKRWRRGTFRFRKQQALIGDWLQQLRTLMKTNYAAASVVANSIESVRGYGDTWERGFERYREKVKNTVGTTS